MRPSSLNRETSDRHPEVVSAPPFEHRFRAFWRAVAGMFGAAILLVGIYRSFSFQGTWTEEAFLGTFFLAGAVLLFVAIAYERVAVRLAVGWKT